MILSTDPLAYQSVFFILKWLFWYYQDDFLNLFFGPFRAPSTLKPLTDSNEYVVLRMRSPNVIESLLDPYWQRGYISEKGGCRILTNLRIAKIPKLLYE